MKRLLFIFALLTLAGTAHAVATTTYSKSFLPEIDGTYSLGTTTPTTRAWKNLVANQICLTADSCRTTWPSGSGSSFGWPFTPATGYVATSTTVGFFNGLFSSASSTFGSNLYLTNTKSQNCLGTDSNGLVGAGTCSGGSAFAYLFPNNATTTSITFTNGLTGTLTGNADTVTNGVYTNTFGNLFDIRLTATTSVKSITTLPSLSLPYSQITGAPGGFAYLFPNNATTTVLTLSGLVSIASTTIVASTTITGPLTASGGIYGALTGNASTASALAANGTNCTAGNYPLGVDASGNAENCTAANLGTVTAVSASLPLVSSGGATPNITWTGLATTSALVDGRLLYGSGPNGVANVATSSLGVTGPITFSGTIGAQVGGASGNFGCATCVLTSRNINTTWPVQGGGALSGDLTITFGGLATTSTWTAGQLAYAVNGNTVTSVATTTLTFSGPFSGTGFGALVGGANTTVAWTGLATSSALSANQVLYATSVTGVAGSNNHVWNNAAGWLGVGTTTPQWLLTLATSTAPQLTLTDALGVAWGFRDAGNNLYIATSSLSTFASSTKTALTIDLNGFPTFPSLGGVTGCAQFDSTGAVSNTGTACGSGSSFAYPFTVTTNYGVTVQATSTPIWGKVGLMASTTSYFDQISVGSSTSNAIATSTFFGNINIIGAASSSVFYAGDGIAAAPSYSFSAQPGLGFFRSGSQQIETTVSGSACLAFDANGLRGIVATSCGEIRVGGPGTAATPNYSFNVDTNTGIFGSNTHFIGFSTNGLENARFTPGGWLGIGTTTPQWELTIASTTAPQLVLQGGVSDAPWAERSIGGALYFATTTNTSTFATSTAANTALTIDVNGFPRFSALGGVAGCAQFDNTGKLSNIGSTCGTGAAPAGSDGQLQYKSNTAFAGIGTTTLTLSGPFSGTGFGKLVGGADTTVTWTGLATTTALTANQVLYAGNSTSGVAGNNNFVWNNAANWLGVGTTTPQWLLSLATTTAPQLVLQGAKTDAPWAFRSVGGYLYLATTTNTTAFATSSLAAFSITIGGEVTTQELDVATTTTTTTIDWAGTPNQVRLRIGSAATNLQFINATNSAMLGSRKLVYVCNPPTVAAGAVTWVAVEWIGSTPAQTTTAAQCDVMSFDITQGTSTSAVYKVAGSAGAGFQ